MQIRSGVAITLCVLLAYGFAACSPAPTSTEEPKKSKKEVTEGEEEPKAQPNTENAKQGGMTKEQCWEKILNTPESKSCTGLFAHSSKTCVTQITKEPTCTKEIIASKYGSAMLNGQPVMTSVDKWITEGYEPNQCGNGSDSKFYVYFVKKVSEAADSAKGVAESYGILDKKLGPSGDILTAIVLNSAGSPSTSVCE